MSRTGNRGRSSPDRDEETFAKALEETIEKKLKESSRKHNADIDTLVGKIDRMFACAQKNNSALLKWNLEQLELAKQSATNYFATSHAESSKDVDVKLETLKEALDTTVKELQDCQNESSEIECILRASSEYRSYFERRPEDLKEWRRSLVSKNREVVMENIEKHEREANVEGIVKAWATLAVPHSDI